MTHPDRRARSSAFLCHSLFVALAACGEGLSGGDATGEVTSPDTVNDGSGSPSGGAPSAPVTPRVPITPPAPDPEGNPVLGGIETPSSSAGTSNTPSSSSGSGSGGSGGSSASSAEPDPDTSPDPVTPASAHEPIIPAPSGACPEFRTGTQTIMGLSTEIVAGEPTDTKGPLLFTWHGTGGSGRQALRQLPESVQRDITARGGIVIAPSDNGQVREGADVTFVLGVWYDGADLAFADQIVACAVQNHNIDPRQIYVTGCSAGGLMAGVMSLERSNYVAAAAPNSGGISTPNVRIEDSTRVPAVMTMHGGDSDTVIVNFGDTSRQLASVLGPLGSFIVECNHNSGHCGAPASLHEQAWQFMLAHPYGTQPSPYASGLPGDFPDFCAIQ